MCATNFESFPFWCHLRNFRVMNKLQIIWYEIPIKGKAGKNLKISAHRVRISIKV